ncbi:MAG: hypothetical protein IJF23_06860 [Clostridia bacterium]|nr:hypothetical protein [Clostridia bacterium]
MKRILAVVLTGIVALSLCACQSNVANEKYPTIKDMGHGAYMDDGATSRNISMRDEHGETIPLRESGNAQNIASGAKDMAQDVKDGAEKIADSVGESVNDLKKGAENMADKASVTDNNMSAEHIRKFLQEPGYIKIYSPLSAMPAEWYLKYRIPTDLQTF